MPLPSIRIWWTASLAEAVEFVEAPHRLKPSMKRASVIGGRMPWVKSRALMCGKAPGIAKVFVSQPSAPEVQSPTAPGGRPVFPAHALPEAISRRSRAIEASPVNGRHPIDRRAEPAR